jgi:hypothetical protein
MKSEVVFGVFAEMIPMLKIMLLLLLLVSGGEVFKQGLQLAFPQLALITATLYRPF